MDQMGFKLDEINKLRCVKVVINSPYASCIHISHLFPLNWFCHEFFLSLTGVHQLGEVNSS